MVKNYIYDHSFFFLFNIKGVAKIFATPHFADLFYNVLWLFCWKILLNNVLNSNMLLNHTVDMYIDFLKFFIIVLLKMSDESIKTNIDLE